MFALCFSYLCTVDYRKLIVSCPRLMVTPFPVNCCCFLEAGNRKTLGLGTWSETSKVFFLCFLDHTFSKCCLISPASSLSGRFTAPTEGFASHIAVQAHMFRDSKHYWLLAKYWKTTTGFSLLRVRQQSGLMIFTTNKITWGQPRGERCLAHAHRLFLEW